MRKAATRVVRRGRSLTSFSFVGGRADLDISKSHLLNGLPPSPLLNNSAGRRDIRWDVFACGGDAAHQRGRTARLFHRKAMATTTRRPVDAWTFHPTPSHRALKRKTHRSSARFGHVGALIYWGSTVLCHRQDGITSGALLY